MKYDVTMSKSTVLKFLEELQRKHGSMVDYYIYSLNNKYVKRKEWKIRVDVEEKFDFPGVTWENLPKCDIRPQNYDRKRRVEAMLDR